jgi:hypothetical protein
MNVLLTPQFDLIQEVAISDIFFTKVSQVRSIRSTRASISIFIFLSNQRAPKGTIQSGNKRTFSPKTSLTSVREVPYSYIYLPDREQVSGLR